MKKIHVIGFTLFAMCAFCVVGASSALALPIVPQWLVSSTTIPLENAKKEVEKVNANVEPEGNLLLLEDMNATTAGDPDILCEIEKALVFLLSNGAGEVAEGACKPVEVDKGTCGSPVVAPVDLPWTTVLLEPAENIYEVDITKGTGGAPGWLAECTVLGLKVNDVCTTEKGKALVENTEDGLVHVEFMEEVEKEEEANCTVGGKEHGLLFGLFFLHALNASGELIPLAVSLVEEVS